MDNKQETKFKETEIGLIPEDWFLKTIPDVAVNMDRNRKPLSSRERTTMQGKIPYYGAAGIIDWVNDYKYDGRYLLIAEDGTVTSDGDKPMLQIAEGKFWVSNHAHVLKAERLSDFMFLYYSLRNTSVVPFITGAVQPKLSQENMNKIKFPWPSNSGERERIADIIGSLDEKIDLNRKMNISLEAIGQALFNNWFGTYLDSTSLPNDWEIYKAKDKLKIRYGKNLPTTKLLDNGYPVYGGNGIIGYFSEYIYELPQIIIACRGAACGALHKTKPKSFVTNNSLIFEIPEESGLNRYYLEYYLKNIDRSEFVTGSAQPQITIANLEHIKILVPDRESLKKFREIMIPISDFMYENECENETLAKLRDSLLPKLMNGKVRVN